MLTIDDSLLMEFAKPAPRYTSYPTAPHWDALDQKTYVYKLQELAKIDSPLSLYFHIPFCHSMCLYCGCSVVLNRKKENEERYVAALIQEMELVCSYLGRKKVAEVHFGGGTPTKLSEELLQTLMDAIQRLFACAAIFSIEIDPRTVYADQGKKLIFLHRLGFDRISFGVQDTNERVQEAVKRRQSLEMTQKTFALGRTLGFSSINIDLIYGLPLQTESTFKETIDHIIHMRPDRIALFSYAYVPWLKAHQKAIPLSQLPTTKEKFSIYLHARTRLVEAGYVAIGMDHFALPHDEMAHAYHTQKLQRNFQGYTASSIPHLVGFGITSIGYVCNTYVQNVKELSHYYAHLDQGILPIHRGKVLTEEDCMRKWVIHTLMSTFRLEKREFFEMFGLCFDLYFADAKPALAHYEREGLLVDRVDCLQITPLGELLIRLIVMAFDAYLAKEESKPQFSSAI